MDAKDLRIGNLITHKSEVIKVTGIGEYGIQSKEGDRILNSRYSTPDLEPIPLTEEWLVKMGFDKYRNCFLTYKKVYEKDYIHIRIFRSGAISFIIKNREGNDEYKQLKSVHQLQNLYFALTGEELTIKE